MKPKKKKQQQGMQAIADGDPLMTPDDTPPRQQLYTLQKEIAIVNMWIVKCGKIEATLKRTQTSLAAVQELMAYMAEAEKVRKQLLKKNGTKGTLTQLEWQAMNELTSEFTRRAAEFVPQTKPWMPTKPKVQMQKKSGKR